MIIRKVHPDMPTSTVALDLLSRVGSQTKYSLSPFKGYAQSDVIKVNGYSDFRASTEFEKYIRLKDTFKFSDGGVRYNMSDMLENMRDEVEEEDEDIEDDIEYDNVSGYSGESKEYHIGDVDAPVYVRAFEDYKGEDAVGKIENFLRTVVYNAINNKQGYNRSKAKISYSVSGDDDDEEVNINELAVEDKEDLPELRQIQSSKETLIRSMYRLNLLSREVGINVVSVLLSYKRFAKTDSSKIAGKPLTLVQNGPVYIASSVTGDCVSELSNPNDRHLTRVRNIIWPGSTTTDKLVEEFHGDCIAFLDCLATLSINASHCDATKYTWEWISSYSKKVLVNNYAYVCRKIGGYNMNVLNSLQNMSLDMVVNESREEEVDPYLNVLNLIESAVDQPASEFPPQVYSALRKRDNNHIIDVLIAIQSMLMDFEDKDYPGHIEPVQCFGEQFSAKTTQNGFLLNESERGLYLLKFNNFLPKICDRYLTGLAYVHCQGYVVFESLTNATVIIDLEVLRSWANSGRDTTYCPRYVIGPGRSDMV